MVFRNLGNTTWLPSVSIYAIAVILAIGFSLSPANAAAYQTQKGALACTTLDDFKEGFQAIAARDMQYLNSLKNCIIVKGGMKVYVLERQQIMDGLLLVFKVRAFTGSGQSVLLWMDSQGVNQ